MHIHLLEIREHIIFRILVKTSCELDHILTNEKDYYCTALLPTKKLFFLPLENASKVSKYFSTVDKYILL